MGMTKLQNRPFWFVHHLCYTILLNDVIYLPFASHMLLWVVKNVKSGRVYKSCVKQDRETG